VLNLALVNGTKKRGKIGRQTGALRQMRSRGVSADKRKRQAPVKSDK
jgi:hypothetical protein